MVFGGEVIKFPKAKAKAAPPVAASDLMRARACCEASANALVELAANCAASRRSGEPSPLVAQTAALAGLFTEGE